MFRVEQRDELFVFCSSNEEPIDVSHFLDLDASTAATNISRVYAVWTGSVRGDVAVSRTARPFPNKVRSLRRCALPQIEVDS